MLLPDEIAEARRSQRAVNLEILGLLLTGHQTSIVRHNRPPLRATSPALTRTPVAPSVPASAASASITE